MDPTQEIKMVWENLALAMALSAGVKKGLITTAQVPTGRAAVPTDDGGVVEVFNPLDLRSNQDLTRCINNQVRGAVTFSAMQTHGTMAQVFPNTPLREVDADLRAARGALFLLYNTLSQGMLAPVWRCPPAYRQRFEVRPISFVLDASHLDGKEVFWQDFGGLGKYLDLLEYCIGWLEQVPRDAESTVGVVAPAGPTPENQLSMALLGDEPVAAFIQDRCVMDPDGHTMAKDLYDQYLEWCRATEQESLVQRNFGIQLTNLGFVRKRRGRGRHWWRGVRLQALTSTGQPSEPDGVLPLLQQPG